MKQFSACALLFVLISTLSALASIALGQWPPGTILKYTYNSMGEPSGAGDAFRDAAASWNAVLACYSFEEEEPRLGVVQWITSEDIWDIIREDASKTALSVTAVDYELTFAVYFNVAYWSTSDWSTSCEAGKADVKSISLHELGHVLGLGECPGCASTVMKTPYDMTTPDCWSEPFAADSSAVSSYCPFNPAASLGGFYVSGGLAHWRVTSEYKTSSYRIEGAPADKASWEEIAAVPAGIGDRTAAVAGGFSAYRLVEIEEDGDRLIYGMVKPGGGEAPFDGDTPTVAELRDKLVELAHKRKISDLLDGRPALMGDGKQYVIFTVDSLVDEVESYVADYWRGLGYSVVVNSVDGYPSDPDDFRDALKGTISSFALGGAKYFHLIGDANDWQQFSVPWPGSWEQIRQNYLSSGYPPDGQPEKDLIPTWSFPDTLPRGMCVSYYVPYTLTDKPYSDTDCDGVPDVVVTRWPVTTEAEVLALAYKMQLYVDCGVPATEYSVLTCVGDLDHMQPGDGAYASSVADTVVAMMPAEQDIALIYESDYPIDGERNTAVAGLWNEVDPSLMLMVSSISNRSWPGNYFVRVGTSNPFHMGMLEEGYPAVVFGLTCDTGDFARTEDPNYGRPVFERFLVAADKGAIAWIGPVLGSWQRGNKALGKYFIEELYSDLGRPVAESFLIAQQRVYQDYPDDSGLLKTADMYAFLGHPLLPLFKEAVITAAEIDDMPLAAELRQNYPNPFNPTTVIEFQISYGAYAELVIYDVAGRRIRELLNKKINAGIHKIRWDGKSDRGSDVASGIYFCRLTVGELSQTRKLVVLK